MFITISIITLQETSLLIICVHVLLGVCDYELQNSRPSLPSLTIKVILQVVVGILITCPTFLVTTEDKEGAVITLAINP